MIIICFLIFGFSANDAAAQGRCYNIIDLGLIDTGNPEAPFGINNQNQAAYSVNVGGGLPKNHAMLYLPAPAYGFSQPGCYDLHDLAGLDPNEESVAHDINESGIVVGYRTVDDKKHAFIWRLDQYDPNVTPPLPFIDMGTFQGGEWSEAFAVNDAQPDPWIVGMGEYFGDCQCGNGSGDPLQHAFATRLDIVGFGLSQAAILLEDPNLPCQRNTLAFDVNTALTLRVAGSSETLGGSCQGGSQSRATVWTNPTPGGIGQVNNGTALTELQGTGSVAQGISNLGAMVGSGTNSISQIHAVYWPLSGGAIVDLGSLLPTGDQSWAWRINNLADRAVVGRANTFEPFTADGAALWECSSNCDQIVNWSVTDLGSALISNSCNANWWVKYAYDVNDSGSIIAWARKAPWPNPSHAVILVPDETCCLGDFDDDGAVGTSDLLVLLATWGDCSDCGLCVADMDCDGVVGTEDQIVLFANWGPCAGAGGSTSLESAVQQLGFPSVAAHQAWLAQASEPECFTSSCVLLTILQNQE